MTDLEREERAGEELPLMRVTPPGPSSRSWSVRHAHVAAPMGPKAAKGEARGIVYARGRGANVEDVDGNRYVDLAGGFGSLLLGHGHPSVLRVIELQAARLLQALGDVYPADAKIALLERLTRLHPEPGARGILAQSGSDALSAALKTAKLVSGKPGVLAFSGAYHGLGYGPLAACGLRESYRAPFEGELNPHVRFVNYPTLAAQAESSLDEAARVLRTEAVGAILIEPVLGRGGVLVPPPGFLSRLAELARERGALFIADEVWTGLGRSGEMLESVARGVIPDLICLGKGLGGGLPVSAVIGRNEVMQAWQRDAEVVHTSTFAGAPLACGAAIATLDVLSRERLVERSRELGVRFRAALSDALRPAASVREVRGAGLMIGIDLGDRAGAASTLARHLLECGYITSTGGGKREVLVLTPPLNIAESCLWSALPVIAEQALRLH